MKHKKFDFRTAYIDLLLNVLTGIVFLFVLTTLLISTKKIEQEGILKKAEYIATIEWPLNLDCDVDMWLLDPDGKKVSFNNKNGGLVHLERDDVGFRSDILDLFRLDEIDRDIINEESMIIRGVKAGEYIINVHLYACRVKIEGSHIPYQLAIRDAINVPVKFKLVRVNPYRIEHVADVVLTETWQEKNVLKFRMNENKSIEDIGKSDIKLVEIKQQ